MNTVRTLPVMSALATAFLAPLVLAWVAYHAADTTGVNGLQHGDLLLPLQHFESPPLAGDDGRHIESGLFHGHWTLLYRSNGRCADDCLRLMATLRNIRLAQGRAMHRVRRVLVLPAREAVPSGIVRDSDNRDLQVAVAPRWPLSPGAVYLLDPQGNLVMRYPPGFEPRGLLTDLQRLLRLSGEA